MSRGMPRLIADALVRWRRTPPCRRFVSPQTSFSLRPAPRQSSPTYSTAGSRRFEQRAWPPCEMRRPRDPLAPASHRIGRSCTASRRGHTECRFARPWPMHRPRIPPRLQRPRRVRNSHWSKTLVLANSVSARLPRPSPWKHLPSLFCMSYLRQGDADCTARRHRRIAFDLLHLGKCLVEPPCLNFCGENRLQSGKPLLGVANHLVRFKGIFQLPGFDLGLDNLADGLSLSCLPPLRSNKLALQKLMFQRMSCVLVLCALPRLRPRRGSSTNWPCPPRPQSCGPLPKPRQRRLPKLLPWQPAMLGGHRYCHLRETLRRNICRDGAIVAAHRPTPIVCRPHNRHLPHGTAR